MGSPHSRPHLPESEGCASQADGARVLDPWQRRLQVCRKRVKTGVALEQFDQGRRVVRSRVAFFFDRSRFRFDRVLCDKDECATKGIDSLEKKVRIVRALAVLEVGVDGAVVSYIAQLDAT